MTDGAELDRDDLADDTSAAPPTWVGSLQSAWSYLGGALVAWVGAVVANVELGNAFSAQQTVPPSATRTGILQALAVVLPLAGAASFGVGLLLVALRSHERWRRDTAPVVNGSVAGPTKDSDRPVDTGVDETPFYARSNWDDAAG